MLRPSLRPCALLHARAHKSIGSRVVCAQGKLCMQQPQTNLLLQHPRFQQTLLRSFSSTSAQEEADQQAKAKAAKDHDKRIWDRLFAQQEAKQQQELTTKSTEDKSARDQQQALANHRNAGDLLYEYPRKSYFGLMSAASLANIAFWSWLKGYQDSLLEGLPQATMGDPTILSYLNSDVGIGLGFGSSILFAFAVAFHARRAVARISVVAGGEKLRITTHKYFGDYSKPKDYPARHISANPNTKNNIILKIANEKAFFLVDTRGTFYNRPKLESLITFRDDYTGHYDMMKEEEAKKTITVRTDLPKTNLDSASKMHYTKPKSQAKPQPQGSAATTKVNLSPHAMQKLSPGGPGAKASRTKRASPNRNRNNKSFQRKK